MQCHFWLNSAVFAYGRTKKNVWVNCLFSHNSAIFPYGLPVTIFRIKHPFSKMIKMPFGYCFYHGC